MRRATIQTLMGALGASLFLSACGGAPQNNPNYLERHGLLPPTRSIEVTVSGSSGTVVMDIGGRSVTFEENGQRTLEDFGLDETIVASFTSTPTEDTCLFMPSALTTITAGSQVDVQCGSPELAGEVRDYLTDEAVGDVDISIRHDVSGTVEELASLQSEVSGAYSYEPIPLNDRLVVTASTSGFAPYSTIVAATDQRPFITRNMLLVSESGTSSQPPASDMAFTLGSLTILTVPANGLENAAGDPPVGNVTAYMTALDPSSEPRILSGNYDLVGGENIESFGAISLVLTDSEGTKMQLVDGVDASLSVPTATAATAPASAQIYAFDTDNGYWSNPIAATLATSVYDATISSLDDTYTSGATYDTVNISGCLQDGRGNSVAGAQVFTQGRNYIGLATATTDADGNFTVKAKVNSSILVFGIVNARSQTVAVTTTDQAQNIETCIVLDESSTTISLTWGQNPSDLDTHFFGPDQSASNQRFHIWYVNLTETVNDVDIALDVDDTSSFGPEVVTMADFPEPGLYSYYVYLFAGSGTIANSPARVELNMQGDSSIYSPPSGTATDCWHVFDIQVDATLTGTVTPIGNWVTSNDCQNEVSP